MIRWLRSLFRRRPIVVQTFHVKRTDLQQLREKTHAQLARELGMPFRGIR